MRMLNWGSVVLPCRPEPAVPSVRFYVDDVATSAYFIRMYRYLQRGIPKAEAMQMTRQAFERQLVRLEGDQVIGVDALPLLSELTPLQQRRVANGLSNPFYWAGIELGSSL